MSQRVHIELQEVADLLVAAEGIADGLVDVLDHVYEHDHRTKAALAAVNELAVVLSEERKAAEERCS